ncbi:MAG: arsenite efflux transporter metallochaperone ArsD [Deltaproteobacteria bacterium]|nr:arsenite efflux transporter metallochaperone ArsD [Deltaproteobacteria bacterium]
MSSDESALPRLQVYDPPMCCATGVCGPAVDPVLPRFAADLEWLKEQGIALERFNLAQQPGAFARTPLVRQALELDGNDCLPLVVVGSAIVSRGAYPTRDELAASVGLEVAEPLTRFTPVVAELVAIGAAIASNCEPCFKYHFTQARKLGVSRQNMARAVAVGRAVKEAPAGAVLALAERFLGCSVSPGEAGAPPQGAGCGQTTSAGGEARSR